MTNENLAAALARVSRTLADDRDEPVTAERICTLAVEVVAECDHAVLVLRARRNRWRILAESSDEARQVGESQIQVGEGPFLDAVSDDAIVYSPLVADDVRWPAWRERAATVGVRSVIAVPVSVGDEVRGALTMSSQRLEAWPAERRDAAVLYAAHAAIALDAAHVVTGLRTALTSRHQIGVAQGILMERHGLSLGRAFTVLERYASSTNTPLNEVAAAIVHGSVDAL